MLHPNFDPQTLENNIALIELNNSIRFTNTIKTICLPSNINSLKQMMAFRYCVVTGLGKIAEGLVIHELCNKLLLLNDAANCLKDIVTQDIYCKVK